MQILKLVYIAHGWMLGLDRQPLIPPRRSMAVWAGDPDLYHAMKSMDQTMWSTRCAGGSSLS